MPKPTYLLDTNILSELIRQPGGRGRDRIAECGQERICTSIVVASELRFGAAKKGSVRLTAQMEAILGAIRVLPLAEPPDRRYAEVRLALEQGAEQAVVSPAAIWRSHMSSARVFPGVDDVQPGRLKGTGVARGDHKAE